MELRQVACFLLTSCLLYVVPTGNAPLAAGPQQLEQTRQAARRGDADAANRLGVWYEKGKNGLPADGAKAVEWYRRAAAGGSILAMHNLGDCYLNGTGVPHSPAHAYAWYKQAAEAGGAIGYEDIGKFFENTGFGKPDIATAKTWYAAAARQGRKEAQERLLALGGKRQTVGAALPPCPGRETGKSLVAGAVRDVRDYGPEGAGLKMLTLEVNGDPVDILVNGAAQDEEFSSLLGPSGDALRGKSVAAGIVTMQGLEDFSARCGAVRWYAPHSLRLPAAPASSTQTTQAGDIYIGYDGLLLGAFLDKAWVNVTDLQNSQKYHAKRLWGGMNGLLYTAHGLVSECVMGALMNEHAEEFKEHGPLAEFPFFSIDTPFGKYEGEAALIVGGPGNGFNPLPRAVRHVRDDSGHFAALVKEHLAQQGLPDAVVRIREIVAVDLDGDGVEEHIICAEDFSDGMTPPMAGKRGMYSVILLERTGKEGSAVLPAASYVCLRDVDPSADTLPLANRLNLCADVNGDGVMELIINTAYYEGATVIVLAVENDRLVQVLSEGWGV